MSSEQRRIGRLVGIFMMVVTGLTGALTLGGVASAHHPVLSSTVDRPCGPDATWTGTVTAESDQDWDKDWRNRAKVGSDPYGPWTSLADDQVPARFEVGPFESTAAQVTVTVQSEWYDKSSGELSVTSSRSITLRRPDATDCPTTPAEPVVAYDCVSDEIVITGAIDTDAVDYTVTVITEPAGEGTPWAVTITATPQPGYEFPPETVTEWNFDGTVDCLIEVEPAAPTAAYDCVSDEIVITGAIDTDAVDYTVTVITEPAGEGTPWAVTITATPQPGYEFPPETVTEWNFDGTVDCLIEVEPATPTAAYDCVSDEIVITGAIDTDAVDYTVTVITEPAGEGTPWAVTITATPQPGYEFPPETVTEWNFDGTVDCLIEVEPAAPTAAYDCVSDEIVITGAIDTDAVDYTVTVITERAGEGTPWAVTITATPQPGYEFPPETVTEWNFDGTVDCDTTTTPVEPVVAYDCVSDEIVITGAIDTDAVDYTVTVITEPAGEGTPWAVTITATPQPGYEFPPETVTEWNFDGTVDCLIEVEPAAPTAAYDCVSDEIVITGAIDTDAVDYTVTVITEPAGEGTPWAVTITATTQPGYEFPPETVTEWNFDGTVDCDTTTTPVEPVVAYDCVSDEIVITGAIDTDAVDHTVTVITEPAGEGTPWAVTITATPQPGYEFPPETVTEWNFDGTVDCDTTTTPVEPVVAYDCVSDEIVITGAIDTDTVDYTVTVITEPAGEGTPWAVTITATPQPGYEFPPETVTEWNFDGTVDCLEDVTPGEPELVCENDQLAVRTELTESHTYVVTGDLSVPEGGSYNVSVSAVVADGYEFPAGTTTAWTFTGTVNCLDVQQVPPTTTPTTTPNTLTPGPELPKTGSTSTTLLLAYATIMTLAGGFLMLLRRTGRSERTA